jgi:hypothetical protein
MSTNSINSLSSSYLQSIVSSALQSAGLTTNTNNNSLSGISASAVGQGSDSSGLSPFAQVLSTLQQLQQSNPAEYQQVTRQISTNLQTAAQTATSDGNTTAASQLSQLATDFSNASTSGQLPNVQDLAQAMGGQGVGGHHHHHHHSEAASADSGSGSSSSTSTGASSTSASTASSSSSTSQLEQLLAVFQSSGTQNDSLNPMSIILNTLSNAGINLS